MGSRHKGSDRAAVGEMDRESLPPIKTAVTLSAKADFRLKAACIHYGKDHIPDGPIARAESSWAIALVRARRGQIRAKRLRRLRGLVFMDRTDCAGDLDHETPAGEGTPGTGLLPRGPAPPPAGSVPGGSSVARRVKYRQGLKPMEKPGRWWPGSRGIGSIAGEQPDPRQGSVYHGASPGPTHHRGRIAAG